MRASKFIAETATGDVYARVETTDEQDRRVISMVPTGISAVVLSTPSLVEDGKVALQFTHEQLDDLICHRWVAREAND